MIYSDLDKRIQKNEVSIYPMNRIYAHGNLQDLLGYDIIVTDDEKLSESMKNPKTDKEILYLELQDNKGEIYKTKVYLWKHNLTQYYMGLICLIDDIEGIKEAEHAYEKMNQII